MLTSAGRDLLAFKFYNDAQPDILGIHSIYITATSHRNFLISFFAKVLYNYLGYLNVDGNT